MVVPIVLIVIDRTCLAPPYSLFPHLYFSLSYLLSSSLFSSPGGQKCILVPASESNARGDALMSIAVYFRYCSRIRICQWLKTLMSLNSLQIFGLWGVSCVLFPGVDHINALMSRRARIIIKSVWVTFCRNQLPGHLIPIIHEDAFPEFPHTLKGKEHIGHVNNMDAYKQNLGSKWNF